MNNPDHPASPWAAGRLDGRRGSPQLLFGRMFEDPEIEASVFPPRGRVLCIASAGCTALHLAARDHHVTAVDVNPAQCAYLEARLSGAPVKPGQVDRMMDRGRHLLALLGLRERELLTFLHMKDPARQVACWHDRLCTRRLRLAARILLSTIALRRRYAPGLLASLPPRFDRVLLARLARGLSHHPNRHNPFAWELLLGSPPQGPRVAPGPLNVEVVCADVAAYLEQAPARSFDAFSLSNVLDGATTAYRGRLLRAVCRAASPGAVLVLRSFAEPADQRAAEWAARDRAMIWGAIEVNHVASAETPSLRSPRTLSRRARADLRPAGGRPAASAAAGPDA